MFTVSGHYQDEPASLTWDEGEITGHEKARAALLRLADEREVVQIPCMAPLSTNAHLSKPLAAMVLMSQVLFPLTGSSGQVPRIPDTEPGGIH